GSAPTSNASSAFCLLDLPAGSSGKLKAAALDTTGLTPHVVESSEVRFNGGLPDPYPPGLLEAGRAHPSTQLLVQAVGTDLTNASRIEIAAPDSLWQLPLAIVQQSANGFTATAQVAADLPACLLRVISSSGATATFPLAADTASLLSVQPACTNYVKEINLI